MELLSGVGEAPRAPTVVEHYERVAPILERLFGKIPIVAASFPEGFEKPARWHCTFQRPLPPSIGGVDVALPSGVYHYVSLSADAMLWLCHRDRAVEFHSWAPTAEDPQRLRFARILLSADSVHEIAALVPAARVLREILQQMGAEAIPLIGGGTSLAFWIPFADAPEYPPVRHWLHGICDEAVRRTPKLFTIEPDAHVVGRVHLHVASNAPGRFSALPYSLRGDGVYGVVIPVLWSDLERLSPEAITMANFAEHFERAGELFGPQAEVLRLQRFHQVRGFGQRLMISAGGHEKHLEPHGHILRGALAILEDGLPRSADQILAEGVARRLFPATTDRKYVYTSLLEYIARTQAHGHRPVIVQDMDRRFRVNEPTDAWPPRPAAPPPPPSRQVVALVQRLQDTARGADPAAFEIAVCDAFAHLGFAATHVGGPMNPDGYVDAQLGPLGYRVMLECKTADANVHNPDCVEASKYRERFQAQYCALVGPSYGEDAQLASELQTHGVSAWTVQDLCTLLERRSNPAEMRCLFAPGFVSDSLQDVLWMREHGEAKHLAIICGYLREAGWAAQVAAARQGPPANAPYLNEDAAMLMVDAKLAANGSTTSCTRAEVRAAFEYMTSALVATAVWVDADRRDAIVITAAEEEAV